MRHLLSLAAALLVSGTMLAGTVHAQAPQGYYVAVPAAQPTRTAMVTRSTPWSLRGNAYVANRAPERDQVLCELVARNTGALAAFSVAGKAYDVDALAKCNAHAKPGTAAVATDVASRGK